MLLTILSNLRTELAALTFSAPVAYVYNPLDYAWRGIEAYVNRFGKEHGRTLLLGMNPGPWGMAQSGVPFGAVSIVRQWLRIDVSIDQPEHTHPARPVLGLDCPREEVSGKRLWGWAAQRFRTPEAFFAKCFVWNYCPLLFLDTKGANLTPDKLQRHERLLLEERCDHALLQSLAFLHPPTVVGIGKYAEKRCQQILRKDPIPGIEVTGLLHPSPANPRANRGWESEADQLLTTLDLSPSR